MSAAREKRRCEHRGERSGLRRYLKACVRLTRTARFGNGRSPQPRKLVLHTRRNQISLAITKVPHDRLPKKKKGAPNQGRSRDPDQGAQKNSTWPTLPFGSAVQALLLLHEPEGSSWSFLWKQKLDARAPFQIVSADAKRREFCWTPLNRFFISGLNCRSREPTTFRA
jgi:hypothetical protein